MKKSLLLLITLASVPHTPVLAECSHKLAEDLTETLLVHLPQGLELGISQSIAEMATRAGSDLKSVIEPDLTELKTLMQQGARVLYKFITSQKTVITNTIQQVFVDDQEANAAVAKVVAIGIEMRSQGTQITSTVLDELESYLGPERTSQLLTLLGQAQQQLMAAPETRPFLQTFGPIVERCQELAQRINNKIAAARA